VSARRLRRHRRVGARAVGAGPTGLGPPRGLDRPDRDQHLANARELGERRDADRRQEARRLAPDLGHAPDRECPRETAATSPRWRCARRP
jgi:hypothetical protein